MAEGSRRDFIRTVWESVTEDGTEEGIVCREVFREVVVEGEIGLRVEAHRVIAVRSLGTAIRLPLRGLVVANHEAVIRTGKDCCRRIVEVGLDMTPRPGVIQIRSRAVARLVESAYDSAVVVQVGIRASEVPARIDGAGQTIDTTVIAVLAGAAMIRAGGGVRQCGAVGIERMSLLH